MPNLSSTSLAAKQKRFDQLIMQKAELTAELQETKTYNDLQDVETELSELTSELKEAVKEKGDFETKFFRFQMYDQRRVDYKSLMDKLVADKKATPKYLSQFVQVISVVSATPIKKKDD